MTAYTEPVYFQLLNNSRRKIKMHSVFPPDSNDYIARGMLLWLWKQGGRARRLLWREIKLVH